jgi:NADH:ubiquinone oxidoreductase subunit F (NADH-binding)
MSQNLLFQDIDDPTLPTLDGYRRRGGYGDTLRKALSMPREALVTELEHSGLRGRGGAGFSMGKKASFLPKGAMDKYLVCNADESEPGTFKDRELMTKNPHALIEGIIIAAYAAGANRSFIYIRGEYQQMADVLDRAWPRPTGPACSASASRASTTPSSSWSTAARAPTSAARRPRSWTRSRASAATRASSRRFPANQGLYQGPTLINNVETLATIPSIVGMGAAEYANIGVQNSTGTKLVSVSGHVMRPGNYEIELGIPTREIIYGLAGGPGEGRRVKFFFPGGSSSPVLTEDDLDLPYDFDSMAKAGSMLGSGAIIVCDDTTSVVDVTLKLAKFYKHESCGKCTPCREGTNWTVKMLERVKDGSATPMDLDIMASVQDQIIGHCLCVLGDAMAMPVSSLIASSAVSSRSTSRRPAGRRSGRCSPGRGSSCRARAPRRSRSPSTAARSRRPRTRCSSTPPSSATSRSPSSATSPSSASPSGACRMCLVEIEGIPKLQTGCSTPVKDGMVVHTQTDRVRAAQEHVVEFLLINHPLDCPVCDKGGECPLQDVSYGWGGGKSRFIEPKRHFKKPLELSPLVAIDRERCILCYRCVRFSQEIAEDYQLVLHERGAATYVGTFDGHPYVAPFSGNIIELCPVGALTSKPYRFRARPVGHRERGLGLHALPRPVQRGLHRPRRPRPARALARQRGGRRRLAVRQGPLRLPGRPRARAHHRADGPRRRRPARDVVGAGDRGGRGRAGQVPRPRGRARRRRDDERGGLAPPAPPARGLDSGDIDHRTAGGLGPRRVLALGDPALQATVSDLEFAHTGPRPGHGARGRRADPRPAPAQGRARHRMQIAVATERPSSLDPDGQAVPALRAGRRGRRSSGAGRRVLRRRRRRPRRGGGRRRGRPARRRRAPAHGRRGRRDPLRRAPARRRPDVVGALLKLAGALGMAGRPGAGLLGIPSGTNARGLREAGVLPHSGPGLAPAAPGRDAAGIAAAAEAGDLNALYLVKTDPLRDQPRRGQWLRALEKATHVIAHAGFMSEGIRDHATIVFPAESYAEKEGTVTHPDGRVQRLRPAIGRQGLTRPEWQVLAELARRCGADPQVLTVHMATRGCSRRSRSTRA